MSFVAANWQDMPRLAWLAYRLHAQQAQPRESLP
jgi:hypothetical protein